MKLILLFIYVTLCVNRLMITVRDYVISPLQPCPKLTGGFTVKGEYYIIFISMVHLTRH